MLCLRPFASSDFHRWIDVFDGSNQRCASTVVAITEVEFSAMVAARITGGALGELSTPLVYSERDYRAVTSL